LNFFGSLKNEPGWVGSLNHQPWWVESGRVTRFGSSSENDQMCVLEMIRYIIEGNLIKENKIVPKGMIKWKVF